LTVLADGQTFFVKKNTWQESMVASRAALSASTTSDKETAGHIIWETMLADFPVQSDWIIQDGGLDFSKWFHAQCSPSMEADIIKKVVSELGADEKTFKAAAEQLVSEKIVPTDRRWLDLYVAACEKRRKIRLKTLIADRKSVV